MASNKIPGRAIDRNATVVSLPFVSRTKAKAWLFPGRIDGVPVNWTLAGVEHDAPGSERLTRLRQVAEALGLQTMWAPSPVEFNGRICSQSELQTRIVLDETRGITLRRGARADGCLVEPGEALIMSVGGCAILVMEYEGRMVAAHAGLKCLYDHSMATGLFRTLRRRYESVVEAAGRALAREGSALDPARLNVRVLFPLSPKVHTHSLTDERHGMDNRLLWKHFIREWGPGCGVQLKDDRHTLSFNTLALVRAQCERYFRLDPFRVEQVGPDADQIPYASHTRSAPPLRDNRNLVVIKHLE